jgi:hypothetical protein
MVKPLEKAVDDADLIRGIIERLVRGKPSKYVVV